MRRSHYHDQRQFGIVVFIVGLSQRSYQLVSNLDVNQGNHVDCRTFVWGVQKSSMISTINFQS